MATLGGIIIANKYSKFRSGGAFFLNNKSEINHVEIIDRYTEVELLKDNPYVVVRIKRNISEKDISHISYEIAQKALDLLSIKGLAHYSTSREKQFIIWWKENKLQILRIYDVVEAKINVKPVSGKVANKQRNFNIQNQPKTRYSTALYFFRMSQLSTNLFDCFRYLYLGFENIISLRYPKKNHEYESIWIKRVLSNIHTQYNLNQLLNQNDPNIVDVVYDEIYINSRLPLFHAKKDKSFLSPTYLQHRNLINEALKKLYIIFIHLAKSWLNARYLSGGMTPYAFQKSSDKIFTNSTILCSDKDIPLNKGDATLNELAQNPYNCSFLPLSTHKHPNQINNSLYLIRGYIPIFMIGNFNTIRAFVVCADNNLLSGMTFETELNLDYIDYLDVNFGYQLINITQPKVFFDS